MGKAIKNIRNRIIIPPGCSECFLPLGHPNVLPLTQMGVCLSGLSRLKAGYEIGYAPPLSHMLIGTVSGSGWFRCGRENWRLQPNTLLLAPPGEPLAFGVLGKEWAIVWFYIRDLPRWTALKKCGPALFHTPLPRRLQSALDGLLHETGWSDTPAEILGAIGNVTRPPIRSAGPRQDDGPASPRAGRLWCELVRDYLEQAMANESTWEDEWRHRLDELWRTIHARPEQPWRVAELCRKLHVAPATLQRLVKRYEGISPRQMVIRIRIEIAQRLLANTKYPIQIIAQRVGYADQFSFSTAFKQAVGVGPRHFRRQRECDRRPP
ncbi:MAG TPA: AraC family transcriptional regulator [Chthoniobacteraceae bacterium]